MIEGVVPCHLYCTGDDFYVVCVDVVYGLVLSMYKGEMK